jgi:hypothetical protein
VPSRVPCPGCGALCAGPETGEHGVADLPLQRAQGLFGGLALGQFLVVVGAAFAVPVADLGDRGHVDGVVDPPVPAPLQPVNLALAEDTSIGAVPFQAAKRETSRTSPITAAAITGPTPNNPVRLVPAARTATVSLFLVSRSWPSIRRRSSMKAAASSQRAVATGTAGTLACSSRENGDPVLTAVLVPGD